VIWVVRADLAQFVDQLGRDEFGFTVATPPVNDTMPDGGDCRETDCAFEPIDQEADGSLLVRGVDWSILLATAAGMGNDPPRVT
jgi:hypothetical protein